MLSMNQNKQAVADIVNEMNTVVHIGDNFELFLNFSNYLSIKLQ